MIRRNDHGHWLIIEQVDHARLAGDIAAAWGDHGAQAPALPGAAQSTLVWAVGHHDDGWSEWDRSPRIDPATGIPRSFMEMRMRDATAIWTRTIGACSVVPLAGIAVSRHFCHLAQNVLDGGRDDPNDLEAVERFLDQQAAVQSELSNEGRTACPDVEFERLCEHGFRTVRFFDLVSLWLCCADRQEPTRLAGPRGDEVTFVPQSMSRIAIEPYPLTVEPHELHVSVRRIASRRYLNDEDLQQALRNAPTRCLDWTLCSS